MPFTNSKQACVLEPGGSGTASTKRNDHEVTVGGVFDDKPEEVRAGLTASDLDRFALK